MNFDKTLLDDPRHLERDACGVGLIAHLKGLQKHSLVRDALSMLARMDHRGGRAADEFTSDGAGILTQIPHNFFKRSAEQQGLQLPEPGQYALAQCFLPREQKEQAFWHDMIERCARAAGMNIIFTRNVPHQIEYAGAQGLSTLPEFTQFICDTSTCGSTPEARALEIYFCRKELERIARERYGNHQRRFHVVSFSCESVCYKGLVIADHLGKFFPDLHHPLFESAYALTHLRFSTNTQPAWPLAQPFRTMCHNGEINTLRGNINAMHARTPLLQHPRWQERLDTIGPICAPGLSDSAMLDNLVEFLLHSGRSVAHTMAMLIPEPWEKTSTMPQPLRDFYEYHSYLMEPWDGPALIAFAAGGQVGAVLDRNGLRPARYCVTKDDLVICASEAGVLPQRWNNIKESGRLSPGRLFLVDTKKGCIVRDEQIKSELAAEHPYGDWLATHRHTLETLENTHADASDACTQSSVESPTRNDHTLSLPQRLQLFGYTREDLSTILAPMALTGKEAVGSMGSDVPLAVLSRQRPLLFDFFRQHFAQVTNPPVDAIREANVTSLATHLGAAVNLLQHNLADQTVVRLAQPILTRNDLGLLRTDASSGLRTTDIDICFDATKDTLALALEGVFQACEAAVQTGSTVLILTDSSASQRRIPIPALLALSASHHFLIRCGLRGRCSLVVETGEARDTHQCALLLGYGASAVSPTVVEELLNSPDVFPEIRERCADTDLMKNYTQAVCDGLLKIMSKMGITDLNSYRGAQVFEAIGLSDTLIESHFTWTQSRIGGLGLAELEDDCRHRHSGAVSNELTPLSAGGTLQWNRAGEAHLHSPDMIPALQNALYINSREEFQKFCETIDSVNIQKFNIRGLLSLNSKRPPVALDAVEPVTSLVKRFNTGAMSLGSISQEAHETIAVAMNRMGARSNSGEGGEDPDRYVTDHNGDMRISQTKQIASGRFGVTLSYLKNASELQIKIAQGAKPGEGGQLPGSKVDPYIAQLRHSTPGVMLISPPPHHDIYSIEDLAQVIHDLKNANTAARINVKLVSTSGIGTVACGVVKAKAEAILVSGAEGGTGASPVSSIRHAGLPWELGLAEVHRSLVETNLRSRVVLQVDGQLRTPRDLAVAVLLGAQEWSIATGALISLGCIMMRKCHLNSCPVGIATQDPELRKRFSGQPEHLINYIFLLAEGLRQIMAELGFRTIDEMVGRTECLSVNPSALDERSQTLDFSQILMHPKELFNEPAENTVAQEHHIEKSLDHRVLVPALKAAITHQDPVRIQCTISNTDRSVGTLLSSELINLLQEKKMTGDFVQLVFSGSAGQSFMAFATQGISAELIGEANDYVGKGLSGAQVTIKPSPELTVSDSQNVICGNTALYGATSGRLFVRGLAGERFAVRNSGAHAVVEGIGDHGCEYMTGGQIIILGRVGKNFAAGMSGGCAFIYAPNPCDLKTVNTDMVYVNTTLDAELQERIRSQLELYCAQTQSPLASCLLRHWHTQKHAFVGVFPHSSEHASDRKHVNASPQSPAARKHNRPSEPLAASQNQGDTHG